MSLYEVEKILDKRSNKLTRRIEYKVKWKGYPEDEATWQPTANLLSVKADIEAFNRQQKKVLSARKNGLKQQQCIFIVISASPSPYQMQENDEDASQQAQEEEQEEPISNNKKKITYRKSKTKRIEKRSRPESEEIGSQSNKIENNNEGAYNNAEQQQSESLQNVSRIANSHLINPDILDLDSSSPIQIDENFTVLQMCRKEREYLYLVRDSGRQKWISRNQLLRKNPYALIKFYEDRIEFTVLDTGKKKNDAR